MATAKSKLLRYYIRDSVAPFEEDMYHEFKGHRNLSVEELPPWTKESKIERASRKAVSRSINAFLNSGKGGTVYLGILDSGRVAGLKLTQYQKDHVISSLDDLMSRYSPPVSPHRYKVKFVPVVDEKSSEEEIFKQCSYDHGTTCNAADRLRPHQLRNFQYCWCDKDAVAQFNCGILVTSYVVEIVMKPWDSKDQKNVEIACGTLRLHPYHSDEEGNVLFRRQASLVNYSMSQIAQLTRQEVQEKCDSEIQRLQKRIAELKEKLEEEEEEEEKEINDPGNS